MFQATQSSQEWFLYSPVDEQQEAEAQADMFADLMLYQPPYWAKRNADGSAREDEPRQGPPPLCVIAEML
jgi:hypothetical protein